MSSIKGHIPSKFVFYQRCSYIKVNLPWIIVFYRRLSSIVVILPSSCIKCTPSSSIMFPYHFLLLKSLYKLTGMRSEIAINGCLPWNAIFHQTLSSFKGFHLPSSCMICALASSRMFAYHFRLSKSVNKLTMTGRQAHETKVVFHERTSSIKGYSHNVLLISRLPHIIQKCVVLQTPCSQRFS